MGWSMWIFPVAQPRQSRTVPFCLGNGAERAGGLSVLRHEQHGHRGESQPGQGEISARQGENPNQDSGAGATSHRDFFRERERNRGKK